MNNNTAAIFLNSVIDYKEIAKLIENDKHILISKIKEKTRKAISNLEPQKCLSFQLQKNNLTIREVKLNANLEYAQVLIAYMRESTYENYSIESSVTPIALKATEEAIIEFYSNKDIREKISEGVSNQIRDSKLIKSIISKDLKSNKAWLKQEINTLLSEESASSIAGNMIDSISDSIVAFLSSSLGKKLITIIGKFMATGMGKILMKQIAVIVAKALASGVFKSAIIVAIKKIGVGILIKTAVGKAILAILALIGISGIPLAWIIIPIIAGILIYEYNNFPEKLAEKIPTSIGQSIDSEFSNLNNNVIQEIVKVISNDLVKHLTKIKA